MTVKEAVKGNGYVPGLYSLGIKRAQNLLDSNEKIVFACIANVATMPSNAELKLDNLKIKNKDVGVFVVTNNRIFFCDSKLDSNTSKQINLENIQSIDDKSSMMSGFSKVRIRGITEMFIIDSNKKMTAKILSALDEARANYKPNQTTINNNSVSNADEILKFRNLLDKGIITQEEFDIKKKQLLGM